MYQQITLKLAVEAGRHSALARQMDMLGPVHHEQQHLVSIYYDTAQLRLRDAGVTLRVRRSGDTWNQTVKRQNVSQGGLTRRPEWHSPFLNQFDFSGIDDAELREFLLQKRILPNLKATFETNLQRTLWQLEPRRNVRILAKLDHGSVTASGRREAISELELQLLHGDLDDLYKLALQLAQTEALPLLSISKVDRGYRLWMNQPKQAVKADTVPLDPNASPLAVFRLIALASLTQMQLNRDGAIQGDDPEYVHQMRVAVRRLRASLRMFRPVLPENFLTQLIPLLRELMSRLGQARDLDVLITEIVQPVAEALPLEPRLMDLANEVTNRLYFERENTRAFLRRPAHGQSLLLITKSLNSADFVTPPTETQTGPLLLNFAEKRLHRSLRSVQALADSARIDDPTSLHALRIGIKRLRYGIEFFGHLIPGNKGARIIMQLARLQDELGQLNDLASAGNLLMECAGNDTQLREAVTLIGGWHGTRHTVLLNGIPAKLKVIRRLKLPRLS